MWFNILTGFNEESSTQIRNNLSIQGTTLKSKINNCSYEFGRLEVITLGELRKRVGCLSHPKGKISVEEVISDAQELHIHKDNKGAFFQAASQFNLLEMPSPKTTPDEGVSSYSYDKTQGPACAIAAGAGTIYRNYFVPIGKKIGQTKDRQLDCLSLIGEALNNKINNIWEMSNGYALLKNEGLEKLNVTLDQYSIEETDQLRKQLQIGIQWDTQVTLSEDPNQLVSQAYCSALPVSYSCSDKALSEPFARLILEASYEAVFCAAILNTEQTGNKAVFLTKIGGGVFGNDSQWIFDAIQRAVHIYKLYNLDIKITSYCVSDRNIDRIINSLK